IELQVAALFHDVERLVSEADVRIEQDAANYCRFKERHAKKGALHAGEMLANCGLSSGQCKKIVNLIREHERPLLARGSEAEARVLADADALSFFSLNSPGYKDYFGTRQSRIKIQHALDRMSTRARAHLQKVRLRVDVAQLLREALRGRDAPATMGTS